MATQTSPTQKTLAPKHIPKTSARKNKLAKSSANKRTMLAEWEQSRAILLAFPHKRSDWADAIARARECFINIIKAIIAFEPVLVCVDVEDGEGLELLRATFGDVESKDSHIICDTSKAHTSTHLDSTPCRMLRLNDRIQIALVPTNDTWARDFGPLSVLDSNTSSLTIINCIFNGWGLKFSANYDNQITPTLHRIGALDTTYNGYTHHTTTYARLQNAALNSSLHTPRLESYPFVLEGGSIDTDGLGSALSTSACLLESNRNPTYTKADIELVLHEMLGITRVLWIDSGFLEGDDTNSHIDMLARFLDPKTIAYIACDDVDDTHYKALQEMERQIKALRMSDGAAYKLVRLPFVSAIYDEQGARLPASYANFLFVNNGLLVPTYNDPNDILALDMLQDALPNRLVVGVDARVLIEWHGSLHCVSMQLY